MNFLSRGINWCRRQVFNVFAWLVPDDADPWERVHIARRLAWYGTGARLDFTRYLTGTSSVTTTSIDDIQTWLMECRYEDDEALFGEADFWQHPVTFERLRAGDCEDFAVWTWRKLIELGIDADIVAGYTVTNGKLAGRHAWVLFRPDGTDFLFDPTMRPADRMIRPLADVRNNYIPEVGADRTGHRFAFTGSMTVQKRLLREEREPA